MTKTVFSEMLRRPFLQKGPIGLFVAIVAAAILLFTVGVIPARAETDECPLDQATRNDLITIRSGDDKARISAAGALTDRGIAALPTVMEEFTQFKGPTDELSASEQMYFVSIADVLRSIVSSGNAAIVKFRNCRNPSVIKPLVWAASGANQNMRVNATLILGNVVDNTTVCFVLHHLLKDGNMNINGRANLLGITVQMAGYAYKENIDAIKRVLQMLGPKVENQSDLPQTNKLIAEIAKRVQRSPNATSSLNPSLRNYCYQYDYEKELN